MSFDLKQAIEILSATPGTLRNLLGDQSNEWTGEPSTNPSADHPAAEAAAPLLKPGGEQERSWQPYDVIGHLIHGEETDWIPRARIILAQAENRTFVPFDRFAQFERSKGKTLGVLLDEFAKLRSANLATLRSWGMTTEQLDLKGLHPELGEVTLSQLLATWVVHDLNHISQTVTAMAARYGTEVGVWREYLSILKSH